ncbi:response regulator [Aliiglaciecola sp. 2_MG-2023]|uniref:response regulator n=1 Tax=Aliiglaciecola sp. 2_MG-2023 TaxID=3062641 RepID=UPI0026E1D927|nr:response regulator [Aliiglaciecola sp. 2_MG-2023]MDO6711377.1 response regulator [Aliiglaciecola sp. 2_MG-2023]
MSNKRILLAEDNQINQMVFQAMLEATKAELVITNDGQQAVDLFQNGQFDIVFLDIQMSVMDGIEACQLIRRISKDVPLVSLTANVSSQDIKKYLAVGFDYHIGKPIDLEALFMPLKTLV